MFPPSAFDMTAFIMPAQLAWLVFPTPNVLIIDKVDMSETRGTSIAVMVRILKTVLPFAPVRLAIL